MKSKGERKEEEEGRRRRGRGKLKRREARRAQLAREPETTVSLFMGFTGVRSTARAAEGTAPLRTRAWQVLLPSVNRGRRCCLLSRRQPIRPTSRAYVRVYCWPAVAFPGPIISPRNNGLNSERFSREVNVHSFKVIRTSTNANERYQDLCSPSINCASSNGVAGFIISYVLLFPFFSLFISFLQTITFTVFAITY